MTDSKLIFWLLILVLVPVVIYRRAAVWAFVAGFFSRDAWLMILGALIVGVALCWALDNQRNGWDAMRADLSRTAIEMEYQRAITLSRVRALDARMGTPQP